MFFSGLIILALTGAVVYFGGIFYTKSGEIEIEPYIFQPNDLSRDRIGPPILESKLSDAFIQERLIKKFIYEYFYVAPDVDDLKRRAREGEVLSIMTTPEVFSEWKNVIYPELEKYAEQNQMQNVDVKTPIEKRGDYYEVNYDLVYNDQPNKIDAIPKIEHQTLYIIFDYEKGIREEMNGKKFDAGKYLDHGGEAAAIFKFRVTKVAR